METDRELVARATRDKDALAALIRREIDAGLRAEIEAETPSIFSSLVTLMALVMALGVVVLAVEFWRAGVL